MIFKATRRKGITGSVVLPPDRVLLRNALVIASLSSGRSIISVPSGCMEGIRALQEFLQAWTGAAFAWRPEGLVVEGGGLGVPPSPPQNSRLPKDRLELLLALSIASRYPGTSLRFTMDDDAHTQFAMELGTRFFGAEMTDGGSLLLAQFQMAIPPLSPLSAAGDLDADEKLVHALHALMNGQGLVLQERVSAQDGMFRMLHAFGIGGGINVTGIEELDELERRLARLQGREVERTVETRTEPAKVIAGHDTAVPGDTSAATALALSAVLVPGSALEIQEALLTPSRAGAISALRRMGADLEIVQRKERNGETVGTLRARHTSRMVGRKLGPDLLASAIDEIPLLAIAASFAEGETILDLGTQKATLLRPTLEDVASNLRLAGTDVGVYEEGLVIRGREECDASAFQCKENPLLALAFFVMGARAQGNSTAETSQNLDLLWPGLMATMEVEHED